MELTGIWQGANFNDFGYVLDDYGEPTEEWDDDEYYTNLRNFMLDEFGEKTNHFIVLEREATWDKQTFGGIVNSADDVIDALTCDGATVVYIGRTSKRKAYYFKVSTHDVPMGYLAIAVRLTEQEYTRLHNMDSKGRLAYMEKYRKQKLDF